MIDKHLGRLPGIKKISLKLFFLACGQGLAIIAQGSFLALAIAGLWAGEGLSAQNARMVFFLSAVLLRAALSWRREKLLADYAEKVTGDLRRDLLAKVFTLGPGFVQKQGTGNVVTMVLEGIRQVENYLMLFLPKAAGVLIVPLVILVYVGYWDRTSALIMFLTLPVIFLFMALLGQAARIRADKQYHRYRRLANHFVDSLRGLETLKLLGLSRRHGQTVERVSEDYRRAAMGTLSMGMASGFALDFFATLSVAVIALFLGLRLLEGTMLLSASLLVLFLAPEFFLPIREFAGDYHATLDGKKALGAIRIILDMPEMRETGTGKEIGQWDTDSCLKVSMLSVDGVSSEIKRLEDISFSWRGYGKIGVIGSSGAGKSTLTEVLSGFLQPDSGAIEINGALLPHLRQQPWQEQALYIPQHPYIFQGSLLENIRFFSPRASETEVRLAAAQAGLEEVIAGLPAGLQEKIGEGGRELSGGEKQRVVLARAFLASERRILFFDEPTAHIDIETEYEIKKTILPLLHSRLVFIATHRLHWLEEMDWVLLLDRGRLVAQGPPEELRKSEKFRAFLQTRASSLEGVFSQSERASREAEKMINPEKNSDPENILNKQKVFDQEKMSGLVKLCREVEQDV